MNGKVVVNSLLLIFVILNIFLGVGNYQKYIASHKIEGARLEIIKKYLYDRDIEVMCELPQNIMPVVAIKISPVIISAEMRDSYVDIFFENREQTEILLAAVGIECGKKTLLLYDYHSCSVWYTPWKTPSSK